MVSSGTYSKANAISENSFRDASLGSWKSFGFTNEPSGFEKKKEEVRNAREPPWIPRGNLETAAVIGAAHRRAANRHWPIAPKRCIVAGYTVKEETNSG